jgi:uncharacterized membrane protein
LARTPAGAFLAGSVIDPAALGKTHDSTNLSGQGATASECPAAAECRPHASIRVQTARPKEAPMDPINAKPAAMPIAVSTPPIGPEPIKAEGAKRQRCAITGRERASKSLIRLDTLRPTLAERIRADYPDLPDDALIDRREVNRYRNLYIEEILRAEHGEFSEIDRQVVESIANQSTIAENSEEDFLERRTLGQRMSDTLASFGGSWTFLISFGVFMVIWMTINVVAGVAKEAFDPYPFILLNLVLSCLAAVQAPIIMMSQKRQEAKDRMRSLNDYQVNLKAELEIRHLHEKLDHLITKQWQRLAEIQQIQMEMMQDGRRAR